MKVISLIFPHQLFLNSPLLENQSEIYLIEEFLFFKQYKFHKQKIAFHRASMKAYQKHLENLNLTVHYIETNDILSDIREFHREIKAKNIQKVELVETADDWLTQRVESLGSFCEIHTHQNQLFLNSKETLSNFFKKEKKVFFSDHLLQTTTQKLGILIDEDGQPSGGKWTYDSENRKKYPKNKLPPAIHFPAHCPRVG